MSIGIGDITEAKRLRKLYNQVLLEKEKFIEKSITECLTFEQKAETFFQLAKLTGDLKRIDLGIHLMLFGGTIELEQDAYSLLYIVESSLKIDNERELTLIEWQKNKILDLDAKVRSLRAQRNRFCYSFAVIKKKYDKLNQISINGNTSTAS